jgi:hypothetical protein
MFRVQACKKMMRHSLVDVFTYVLYLYCITLVLYGCVAVLMHTCKRELSPTHLVCPRRHNV